MRDSSKNAKEKDEFLSAKEHQLIFKKYKPIKKVGAGSFSSVYECKNILTNESFSMKVENRKAKSSFLKSEAFHLLLLKGYGIPECVSFGHTRTHNILIETLLGKSLLKIAQEIRKGFELTDICLCALQILDRIEWVHSKNMIHRDIKPENFLFGIKDPNIIYLIDFGLCKKYRSDKSGKHMMPKLTGKFNGTVRYASANSLRGKECSRRDDLISIGYMLIYLKNYELPWGDTLHNIQKSDFIEMIKSKQSAKSKILCKDFPKEIGDYMKYCYSLKFEQDPNYDYLRSLFKNVLNEVMNNPKNGNIITFSWLNKDDLNKSKSPKPNMKRAHSPQFRLLQKLKLNHEKNKTISDIVTLSNTKVTSKSVDKIAGNSIDIKNSYGLSSNDDNKSYPRKFRNCKISKADELELDNKCKSFINYIVSPEKENNTIQKYSPRFSNKQNFYNKNISQKLPIKKYNKEIHFYKKIIPISNISSKTIGKTAPRKTGNNRIILNNMQMQKKMNQSNQNKNNNYRHVKNNSTLMNISQNPSRKFMNKTINKTYKSLIPHTEHFEKKKFINKFPQNIKMNNNESNINDAQSIKNHLLSPELKCDKYNYNYNNFLNNYRSLGNFRINEPITNISINNDFSANNIQIFKINENKTINVNNNFKNISLINKNIFDHQRRSYEKNKNNYTDQNDNQNNNQNNNNNNDNLHNNYRRIFRPLFNSGNLDVKINKNKIIDNFNYENENYSSIISTFNDQITKNDLSANLGKKFVRFENRDPLYYNSHKNLSFNK